jgi:hypothetical protein
VVKNAGTHPLALGQAHDVETAVTLPASYLVETKAIALSNAIDALFLCVGHGVAPVSARSDSPLAPPSPRYYRLKAFGPLSALLFTA